MSVIRVNMQVNVIVINVPPSEFFVNPLSLSLSKPAPRWGGADFALPLSGFLDRAKTAPNIDAKP